MEPEALNEDNKPFRILSIDGGGIRGVYPAKFLAQLESELKRRGLIKSHLYECFDLICGTSTGGIIALGLGLGMPAEDILGFYLEHAEQIFGKGRRLIPGRFRGAKHKQDALEALVKQKFASLKNGSDPLLNDCKTSICIPSYDLLNAKPFVMKTKHHPEYIRDYQMPAYLVALSTAAAPTYFDPLSKDYFDISGQRQTFSNKVDGGVFANNPTLIGIMEAQHAMGQRLSNLSVLSLGTGTHKYQDSKSRKRWGLSYWMAPRPRIIELFMQGQSQHVEDLVTLLHKGTGRREEERFRYSRVNVELDASSNLQLDEFDRTKLERLAEKAHHSFQFHGSSVIERLFPSK